MNRKLAIGLVTCLAVAGCDNPPQQPHKPIEVRGPEQDRLHQLNAFDLAIALKRAIYDAGYTCSRVTDAGFIGKWKNLDGWMASCEAGKASRDWAIFTGPDGSAQVRDCKDVPGSGLPECVIKQRPAGSFTDLPSASKKAAQ